VNGNELDIELARLDERLKALVRDLARTEASGAAALKIASDELARRLDTLNHERSREAQMQQLNVPRETFEAELRRLNERINAIADRLVTAESILDSFKARGSQTYILWGLLATVIGLSIAAINLLHK